MANNPYTIPVGTSAPDCPFLPGSVRNVWAVRRSEVSEMPICRTGLEVVNYFSILLADGISWREYYFARDTAIYSETAKGSGFGTYYEQEIRGLHPGNEQSPQHEIARLQDGHYILIVELWAGEIRLLGTMASPMLFLADITSQRKRTDRAASSWRFFSKSRFPACAVEKSTPFANFSISPFDTVPPYADLVNSSQDGGCPGGITDYLWEIPGKTEGVDWEFRGGATETDENPAINFLLDGTFFIKLTISTICGDSSVQKSITIGTAVADPVLQSLSPPDGSGTVNPNTLELVLTFNVTLQAGTGSIYIYDYSTDTLIDTILISGDPRASIVGPVLTIDLSGDLLALTQYYILADTNIVQNLISAAWPSTITAKGDWDFTTITPDVVPPNHTLLTPLDGAENVNHDSLITSITFDESVQAGAGDLLLKDYADDSIIATIPVGDPAATFSTNTVQIDWGTQSVDSHYYITIAAGVITDTSGNAWAGITTKGDWDFTTLGMAFSGSTTKQTDFRIQMTCGAALIDWGDGGAMESVNFGGVVSNVLHTYASPGTYNFAVYANPDEVLRVDLNSQDLTGTVDVSALNNMSQLRLYGNSNLTTLLMPTGNTAIWEYFYTYQSGITSIDLSGCSNMGGSVWVHQSPALASVTWGSSTQIFTGLNFRDCVIAGPVDLSGYTGLGGVISGYGNSGITSLVLPTSSQVITSLNFQNCAIAGAVDASGLAGIEGNLNFSNNANMTSFAFPASPTGGAFSSIYFNDCTSLTGLDFSSFGSSFGASVRMYLHRCSAMTSCIFPTTSNVVNDVYLYECDLTGTLDISGLSNLSANFQVRDNPNLTAITWPTCTNTLTSIVAYGCNLTGAMSMVGMTGFTASFSVHTNPLLTGLIMPISTAVCTTFTIYGCALVSLDISDLSGLGGNIQIYNMSTLTSITWPTSSQPVTTLTIRDNDLTGSMSMVGMTGLGGIILGYGNPNLTGITFPTSLQSITSFQFYNCGFNSIIDISGLSNISGTVLFYGNSSMTGFVVPTTGNTISRLELFDCDLTGTLNLSGLSGLSQDVEINGNSNLTAITWPSASGNISNLNAGSCGLDGSTDLSGLTFDDASISLAGNATLTNIILPTSGIIATFLVYDCDLPNLDISGPTWDDSINFRIYNNSMSAAEVNQQVVDMETYFPASGTGNVQIEANAAPDTTSGGVNGTAAISNMVANGYFFTHA